MSKRKIRPSTPGPWNYFELSPEDPDWELCEVWAGDSSEDGDGKLICSGGLGIANARLIAAAPELLECARIALGLFKTYAMQDMSWSEIQKELDPEVFNDLKKRHDFLTTTISKAEGGE